MDKTPYINGCMSTAGALTSMEFKLRSSLGSMEEIRDKITELLHSENISTEEDQVLEQINLAAQIINMTALNMLKTNRELQQNVQNDFQKIMESDSQKAEKNNISDSQKEEENNIIFTVDDNKIFLKMRLLPSIYSKYGSRRQNKSYPDHVKISEIYSRLVYEKQINFSDYSHKIFHYVFVAGKKKAQFLADSDNHDTKRLTDIIAAFLPGGDSAATTSFFYESFVTDDYPEGTYLAVYPGDTVCYTAKHVLDKTLTDNNNICPV